MTACRAEAWTIAGASTVWFDEAVTAEIEAAAGALGLSHMRLFSGAGHDARQLASICPSGMIFVPCEKGVSHNEAENAAPEDLAAGARVLVETLVRLSAN